MAAVKRAAARAQIAQLRQLDPFRDLRGFV
jgi:hypothetical protein